MRSRPEPPPAGRSQTDATRSTPPSVGPRRKDDASKRLANGIVALSSAAIVAIYATGYVHTAPAAASVAPTAIIASVAATPTATAASLLTPTATAATTTATTAPTSAAAITTTTTAPTPTPVTTPAAASAPLATATVAATATPTAQPTQAVASSAYQDGTYTGSGTSRHGGVTVAVTIKNGVIVSAEITASNTRYPISRIAALPSEVVAAQSASIDFVSGATDSSMAFQTAVASALAQAKGA